MKQQQFLEVVDRDEAERRWHAVIGSAPLPPETLPLERALGGVLAGDIVATVDVPGFDRSNLDGFAVRSEDTFGASEEVPLRLRLNPETLATGIAPSLEVTAGTATPIATGGMLPRGADAVLAVEDSDVTEDGAEVLVRRARTPGAAVSFAGTDIGQGETVLFAGTRLTSRETGVLAAIGRAEVSLVRRPRVAILSTGDEIVQPGAAMRPGLVYDSNGRILADAVRELGAEPEFLGVIPDDRDAVRRALGDALERSDLVLLSGGTSKGEGDLNHDVVSELEPGIVVHGVALKPGKPICLAASGTKPVVILPGFPTSAVFTFHEFVAPVIRCLAGFAPEARQSCRAQLAQKVVSERGRLEYLLVGLVEAASGREESDSVGVPPTGLRSPAARCAESDSVGFPPTGLRSPAARCAESDSVGVPPTGLRSPAARCAESDSVGVPPTGLRSPAARCAESDSVGFLAYPMGKGSGSVTAFSRADGFVRIDRNTEIVEAGSEVSVTLIGRELPLADLVVIGSHCVGLDVLAGALGREGYRVKVLAVGSEGGLAAAQRGECDVAPIHLLDPETGVYNAPFLGADLELVPGYARRQGVVTRPDETRETSELLTDPALRMVNRNRGSGTRVLIDELLGDRRPPGHAYEPRSHFAVAAAVAQKRADWGVAIETVARAAGLRFRPLRDEHYDFAVPRSRLDRPALRAMLRLLAEDGTVREALRALGFEPREI